MVHQQNSAQMGGLFYLINVVSRINTRPTQTGLEDRLKTSVSMYVGVKPNIHIIGNHKKCIFSMPSYLTCIK